MNNLLKRVGINPAHIPLFIGLVVGITGTLLLVFYALYQLGRARGVG